MDIRATLVHAVTRYDRTQEARSAKRGSYNPYALSLYLGAVSRVVAAAEHGQPIRKALVENMNGRLLDVCLKAVGEPKSTRDEQR